MFKQHYLRYEKFVKSAKHSFSSINHIIQKAIIVQQLKIQSATYNVPHPFIVVAILPQDAPPRSILSQLVCHQLSNYSFVCYDNLILKKIDRFYVSYRFDDESLSDTPNAADQRFGPMQPPKRIALVKSHVSNTTFCLIKNMYIRLIVMLANRKSKI